MRQLISSRVGAVRSLLSEEMDTAVLRRQSSLAWLTAGGRTYVDSTETCGVAAVVIEHDRVRIVTTRSEGPRLQEEELRDLDAEWDILPWSSSLTDSLPAGANVGLDLPVGLSVDIMPALLPLQFTLDPTEVVRYRSLCSDTADALTDAWAAAGSRDTERDLASRMAQELAARSIHPVVLLAAGESRVRWHRHPLPTDAPIGAIGMASVCGRRDGLISSITRFAVSRARYRQEAESYGRLLRVEGEFLTACISGNTVGRCWLAGAGAYQTHGFEASEWEKHHQGGRIGYQARYYLATRSSEDQIAPNQAFAWNPTVPGLKVEDTLLVTERGSEILSVDSRWPTVSVDGRNRPDLLASL